MNALMRRFRAEQIRELVIVLLIIVVLIFFGTQIDNYLNRALLQPRSPPASRLSRFWPSVKHWLS